MAEPEMSREQRLEHNLAENREYVADRVDSQGRPVYRLTKKGGLQWIDYSPMWKKVIVYGTMPIWFPISFVCTLIVESPIIFGMFRDWFKEAALQRRERNFTDEEKEAAAETRHELWLSKQDEEYQRAMRAPEGETF